MLDQPVPGTSSKTGSHPRGGGTGPFLELGRDHSWSWVAAGWPTMLSTGGEIGNNLSDGTVYIRIHVYGQIVQIRHRFRPRTRPEGSKCGSARDQLHE